MNEQTNSFLKSDDHFKKTLEAKRWGILIAIFFYTFLFPNCLVYICLKFSASQIKPHGVLTVQ